MRPVFINGFLYWVKNKLVYTEDRSSCTEMKNLTRNELLQISNFSYNDNKDRIEKYLAEKKMVWLSVESRPDKDGKQTVCAEWWGYSPHYKKNIMRGQYSYTEITSLKQQWEEKGYTIYITDNSAL